MSTKIITTTNDSSFLSISRRIFGDDLREATLRRSNPGIREPIPPGVIITIPYDPSIQNDAELTQTELSESITPSDDNETYIYVDGVRIQQWYDLNVVDEFDGVSSAAFKVPFNPSFVKVFAPLQFQSIVIVHGSTRLFTGIVVNPDPRLSIEENIIIVECQALPSTLWDCTIPASMSDQTEFLDYNLIDIANVLCEPFGITVRLEAENYDNTLFENVAINVDEKIGPFLAKLARQRRLVLGTNRMGELVFRNDEGGVGPLREPFNYDPPVTVFEEGSSNTQRIKLQLRQREWFTSVSGFEPVEFDFLSSEPITVRIEEAVNTVLQDGFDAIPEAFEGFVDTDEFELEVRKTAQVNTQGGPSMRPRNVVISDVNGGDMQNAVEAAVGRMYANVASWSLQTPTWITERNTIFEPGQQVNVLAPSAFILRPYTLTIRKTTLDLSTEGGIVARLDLMFVNAFSGRPPRDGFPWENLS